MWWYAVLFIKKKKRRSNNRKCAKSLWNATHLKTSRLSLLFVFHSVLPVQGATFTCDGACIYF